MFFSYICHVVRITGCRDAHAATLQTQLNVPRVHTCTTSSLSADAKQSQQHGKEHNDFRTVDRIICINSNLKEQGVVFFLQNIAMINIIKF